MKFTFLVLILLLSQAPTKAQQYDPALLAQFDTLLAEQYQPNEPGCVVLVARHGEIMYEKAIGMADMELNVPLRTDMIFRIGSVTKQFTAVAILQLVEQGKLSLQDEITKFIPDYPTQGKTITVEHLLTHTSGIKSYTDMKEWDEAVRRKDFTTTELIDYFKNQPMDFEPGTDWQYNNSGFILLGYIIEKVSGKTYGEYINDNMFKPLGMKNSSYDNSGRVIKNRAHGYQKNMHEFENAAYLSMTQPYAAGSLLSTVEDLLIWTKALHANQLVKSNLMQKAFASYILPNGKNTHYGYGLARNNLLGSPTIEHSGGINGFLSNLIYLPREEICVAMLTNCDCNPPNEVSSKIAALVAYKELTPKPIALDAAMLDVYTGVFENESKEQRVISIDKGSLYSQRSGGSKFKLIPYGRDQFYFDGSFARATFIRDAASGKVLKINVSDRSAEENLWIKTDKPLPVERKELKLSEAQIQPFTGEYELMRGFSIEVSREGAQLFIQATGQEKFEVFAESPTKFFLKVVDAVVEFVPDDKGVVSKMILFQGGKEMEGKRVK